MGFARAFCKHDPKMINAVLRIVLDVIEQALRQLSWLGPHQGPFWRDFNPIIASVLH
jgi:hypothetical protein